MITNIIIFLTKILFFFKILYFIFFFNNNLYAELLINVNDQEEKIKLAFYGFHNNNSQTKKISNQILQIIYDNLSMVDKFHFMKNSRSFKNISNNKNLLTDKIPDFSYYNRENIDAILVADFSKKEDSDNFELKIRLWDIFDNRQLFGKYYLLNKDNYNYLANEISDHIFMKIMNENIGQFHNKIIYIAEFGLIKKRIKRLSIMDFNGRNHKYITNGKNLVLTPIFFNDNNNIIFLRYKDNNIHLYKINLITKDINKIGKFTETSMAPSVNPINQDLLLISIIDGLGNTDIYEINLITNQLTRLTRNLAIDTTASYYPDGNNILFSSDREDSQKIYKLNKLTGQITRISKLSGSYSNPVISKDGQKIAFIKIKNNLFHVGIMDNDGKNETILVTAHAIDGLKFSPNFRYLIYSKQKSAYGKESIPYLYIYDLVDYKEIKLNTPAGHGASDPDWK